VQVNQKQPHVANESHVLLMCALQCSASLKQTHRCCHTRRQGSPQEARL
jgi:hypothetical protein